MALRRYVLACRMRQCQNKQTMADIRHSIQISVSPGAVYPLVATAAGFAQWLFGDGTTGQAATYSLITGTWTPLPDVPGMPYFSHGL